MMDTGELSTDIAVIGMHGRFPGASDLDGFWSALHDGIESIRAFTEDELASAGVSEAQRAHPLFVNAGSVLDEPEGFDARFFGISRREAEVMDPQHRLLLECAWAALEHAGYDPMAYPGVVGVFGGVAENAYYRNNLATHPELLETMGRYATIIANEREFALTRIAYKLNLTGPALSVNTACSTSGVALHLACQALIAGECDAALVGGARIRVPLTAGYLYQEDGILSPDGHCRAFDADGRGTVIGNGGAVVVVKRLEDALRDADTVHAIIKGTAINNDGADKIGFTAPGVNGQASVIREAMEIAGVDASTLSYVEAHGTGTFVGDPIEVEALTRAFRVDTDDTGFCRIGSVKTNIGHLDAGAGVAGLIKVILSLQHEEIPPSLHFATPNPQIDFAASPFVVNDTLHDWSRGDAPRRAGVSSFGLGGTNAHIVVEEQPAVASEPTRRAHHLLALSARSAEALEHTLTNVARHLNAHAALDLGDVSHTLAAGRRPMDHRAVAVASDTADAVDALAADGGRVISGTVRNGAPSPVFMFPGGGAQYIGMARDLYDAFDEFRYWIDRSADSLRPRLEADLRALMWPDGDAEALERPAHALPGLVAVEVATAQLLQSLGVRPNAVIGHSAGEYAAACLAGVLSLEDALHLVTLRGELFEELPDGAMLSVPLPEAELAELLGDDLSIAVINRPDLCIVSGAVTAIDRLEETLAESRVDSTRLHISVAAHSPMVEPILDRFEEYARTIGFRAPIVPMASNLTGTWITDDEATDPAYWVRHLRQTVRFVDGLSTLLDAPDRVAVEVGPGRTLSGLARQHRAKPTVVATIRHPNEQRADDAFLLEAVGRLWLAGADVDIAKLYDGEERRRVPLPTYPFERQRYWIAPGASAQVEVPPVPAEAAGVDEVPTTPDVHMGPDADPPSRHLRILAEVQRIFHELTGIEPADLDPQATFLELGFDSLFMTQASGAVGARFDLRISFRQLFEEAPTIDALAGHIDERLPADAFRPPPTAAPAASPPPTAATTATDGAPTDTVERLIEQQLEIMRQQLAVLGRQDQPVDARPPSPGLTEGAMVARSPDTAAPPVAPTDGDGEADGATPTHGPWRPIERTSDALGPKQREHIDALAERLLARSPGSRARTQQSRARLADPRTVAGFRRAWKELVFPVVATRSQGSRIWDVDDNELIDIAMGFGVNLFGHSPAHVIDAVTEQIARGIEIGPQTPLAAEVADLVSDLTDHERVAFCNTGSEAVLAAMRLARTVTGRTKIVTFSGDYHGLFDEVLVRGLGTAGARRSMPIAPGVPRHMTQDMIVLEYGSDAALDEIRSLAHELAAVLVEPVQSRHPDLQPARFLRELRALTADAGVPLIFDEMITGFRSHPGGAQALFDVQADLATYGKVVGGGFPIGVVAGRGAYMDALDGGWWQYGDESVPEADVTWFAGTFVRHPVALAASRATLRHLIDEGPQLQADLSATTTAFVDDLNAFLVERGAPMHIEHFSSLFLTTFSAAQQFSSLFYFHLRDHGIHITEGRAAFLSTAHTADDIAAIADAYKRSVVAMQDAELLPRAPALTGGAPRTAGTAPLTEGQQEIWLASQLSDANNCAYNLSNTLHVQGTLDADAMRRAIQGLVDRHEALRTTIDDDGARQRVAPRLALDIALVDLRGLADDARYARLDELRSAEVETPFDLSSGPLVRAGLLRLADDEHLLFLTVHHIICDGWSAGVLFRDLSALYTAARTGGTASLQAPMQLSDYARWQDELHTSPEWEESARHWLATLEDPLPFSALPTDRPRPARRTLDAARQEVHLSDELVARLRAQSSASGRTLFTTMLAAFQCLLQRVTRSEDVLLGMSIAGQTQFPGRDLVGHCINMLPLRAAVPAEEPFTSVSRHTHLAVLDAVDHQNVSYGAVLKRLRLQRDPSRPALVSVVFNMDSPFTGLDLDGLEATPGSNPRHYENFDVFVNLVPADDGLTVECTYNVGLYDAATIRRRLEEYEQLLTGVADDPDANVSTLPLLSPGDRELLGGFNATGVAYPSEATLGGLFAAQVAATPDAPALVDHDGTVVSYAQLAARANQLAWWLRDHGVTTDTLVGVFAHRSIDMVIALYAIIAAGGAYVPLDPDYPDDRLGFMIDEAAMPVVLTQDHLRDRLTTLTTTAGVDATIATLDRDPIAADHPTDPPPPVAGPDDLAYVIYTSGSTGRPKGVANTHRGICNRLLWMQDHYQLDTHDRVLQKTPFSFDVSVWEFFWPLQVGARLVIAAPDGHRDAGYLIDTITRHHITTIHFVPSMLRLFLDHHAAATATSLQRVICSGEALTADLRDRFFDHLSCGLHNLYGPTEAAVDVTAWQCHPDDDDPVVPIGRPIANTTIHILDPAGHPTPIGVPGELHIGGVQVARGYVARPDLTRERFIDDPFDPDPAARLYKTGDLARWLPDGTIDFLGRLDFQVKLHGVRIELGEIEATLGIHPNIRDATVILHTATPTDHRLVAYLVTADGTTPPTDELRAHLRERLPGPMIPSVFVSVDALPLTASGKVDRNALPEVDLTQRDATRDYVDPTTTLEKEIAAVWSEVLGIERVGARDDFFELGGHSLQAMQATTRLRTLFSVELPLTTFFEHPTVAEQADAVTDALATAEDDEELLAMISELQDEPVGTEQADRE